MVSDNDQTMGEEDDIVPDEITGPSGAAAKSGKKKTASETYTKASNAERKPPLTPLTSIFFQLTQLEHILKRPDSYIGSVESVTQQMWTYDSDTQRMVFRDVSFVPGFYKIVDEILVNAADNKVQDFQNDLCRI